MALNLFSKKGNDDEPQQNINKVTSDKAKDIIKTLSGGEVKYTKKVIDNVVVVTGAAGGTGVSTLVANIAHLAANKGIRVLVIDLNIMYPSQHIFFGAKEQEISKPDLVSFLTGKTTLGDSIENNGRISLMYANNRTLMDSLNCEADIALTNFTAALNKVRQLFDLVLIDCPLKVEHALCNTAFYESDSIYSVWDEGISSIANTERIRRNMAASGIDAYTKMRAILNKRTGIHYNNYPFQKLNMELVSVLPFEQDIINSSLRSEVFCHKGASRSKNASIFYNEMQKLTDEILKNGGFIE